MTVQDPASKKWSTTAIVAEEREHGNSYVLTTEGTDKTFIRGQRLLKPHSVPQHSQVNPVQEKQPNNYTPPTTRSKTKSYLEAAQSTMTKGERNNRNKGKEVCRRLRTTDKDNVTYSGEGRRSDDEPHGEQLWFVQSLGRCWDSPRFKSASLYHDRPCNPRHVPTIQNLESEQDKKDAKRGQKQTIAHTETTRTKENACACSGSSACADHGKTTSLPGFSKPRRNPGGPIRTLASYKAASYAAAKPNAERKYKNPNRYPRCNVRRKQPYHKHAEEKSSDGCDKNGNGRKHIQQPSIQQLNVQQSSVQQPNPAGKEKHAHNSINQTKPKKTLAAIFCGYPSDNDDRMDLV